MSTTLAPTKRTIAVFTGNRAEYGLQVPILRAIVGDQRLDYQLLVSGAHLKDDFGRTLQEIEADGFAVHHEVRIDMGGDSLQMTAQAIGTAVISLSGILGEHRPDFLVVYADRFESFAAMIAGTQMGIPTAHIEGGDYTEGGALDDSVRHAMTKLAHLHFTTNEHAADRVRRMGEEPWRVHNVGLPSLDQVAAGDYPPPEEVCRRFGLDPARPILIFTQHSVATEFDRAAEQVRPSIAALEDAARYWGCQVIVTYPNDDAGGRRIMRELEQLEARHVPGVQVHRSLGRLYYHGVLSVATACLGNSSSGIKETPAFHCACIDIGPRQQGRLRADNVIQVPYDTAAIKQAIWRCLHDDAFRATVRGCANPYLAGNAGRRIADVLASTPIDARLIQKRMTY
jgi:UDP-N-acetylglucosamine 2-epimerase (non-hydrolysing)/GDP/UDP-N,N'-diacetylbacillosamine 2-epimerase (hydrolysing)